MSQVGRVALLVLLALPVGRAAADEGESAVSVGLGFASFAITEHDGLGAGLGIDYERGLSDAFWLRASAAGAYYRAGDAGAAYAGQATVGLTYVIDVLKYVPYLHIGAGGAVLGGESIDADVHPLAEIGVGLDILARRGLSYGPFARLGSFFDDSALLSAGVRLTWRWGFF